MQLEFTLALIAAVLAAYILPGALAWQRAHHQRTAILVLNLLLGWTFLGWVIALVWACTATKEGA